MKNPFLQDRNIFSKVQKPTPKLSKDDKQPQIVAEKIPSYDSKYALKPQNKAINTIPTNVRGTNQISSTYQRQTINYTSSNANLAANRYSSQKITFGDPTSSQAYHGDRTSGYFNMMSSQQQNTVKPVTQNKFENLKYEPKNNNLFKPDNKKQSYMGYDMKETRKQFGNYGNYGNKNEDIKMEFSPPPINNFTATQPISNKYQLQANNYQYKPYGTNQNPSSYQAKEKSYQGHKQTLTNDSNFINRKNPFTSNSYKSPPKQHDPMITQKNDISQRFKDNNYAQFSPIGQVSRHKINQDSIMNLDGIMDGIELDKLLAESKTQEELLKILGMDTSMIKKTHDSGNKYQPQYDFKINKYENRPIETNAYISNFDTRQNQNQFSKNPYQPQVLSHHNRFQTFKNEDDEPQVFNYGQSSIKNTKTANNQPQNYRQTPLKFTKPSNNTYNQSLKNTYNYSQIPDQKPIKNQTIAQKTNQQDKYDLEKIMQKQMEKYMIEREGFSKDRRVFITANQKIITKKYKLQSL